MEGFSSLLLTDHRPVDMTAKLSPNDRVKLLDFFKVIALRDDTIAAECTLKFSKNQSCPNREVFIEMMPAYVKSIKDHGFVLSFGLPSMSGFLPSDTDEQMKEGMLVQGVVTNVNKEIALITMKSDRKLLSNSMVEDHRELSVDLLIPGVMVNARMQAIMHNGLLLSFLTYFMGTVDIFHLQDKFPDSKWNEKFNENARLKARFLYVNPITKAIDLTLNPYLLQNHNPPMRVQVGDIFDKAKIIRVDHGIGLSFELPSKPGSMPGYVNINDVSDDHVEKIEKKFKEGNKVTARVLGCKHADGVATASLKLNIICKMDHSDLRATLTVSKEFSEAAILARKEHFLFLTPRKNKRSSIPDPLEFMNSHLLG